MPAALKRTIFDAALMLRVSLWSGPWDVMKFGPIGIAGDLDQPKPPRHDHIEALAKRRRRGLRSMRSNVSFICAYAVHVRLRFAVTTHIALQILVPLSCNCRWDEWPRLASIM